MLPISDAKAKILDAVTPKQTIEFPLLEAMGLVLAEAPVAELDMPPFDKSAVDGYAVRASDAVAGRS